MARERCNNNAIATAVAAGAAQPLSMKGKKFSHQI